MDLEAVTIEGVLTFGDAQAMRYQDSFHRTFELLAYMPTIGRKSERGVAGERRFVHGSHVIYYLPREKDILIQAVIYGPTITDIWG